MFYKDFVFKKFQSNNKTFHKTLIIFNMSFNMLLKKKNYSLTFTIIYYNFIYLSLSLTNFNLSNLNTIDKLLNK